MKSNTIYLLATYYRKPARPHASANKGFGQDPNNFKYDEQVAISRNLKNRDIDTCGVILDMAAKKIVKNSMGPGRDFDELYRYFKTNYPKYIEVIEQRLNPVAADEPAAVVDSQPA